MTVVFGVIGFDVHSIGNSLLDYAFKKEGIKAVNLGVQVSQEEFIKAAIGANASAIFIGSLCGHAEVDCEGFREKCIGSGLRDILLYIGGNLTITYSKKWDEIEKTFK